jgi:hypothetical protein
MAVVMLRAPLRDRADGRSEVDLPGDSIGAVLSELSAPTHGSKVFNEHVASGTPCSWT